MVSDKEFTEASDVESDAEVETKKQKKRALKQKTKKAKKAWDDSDSEIESEDEKPKKKTDSKTKKRDDEVSKKEKQKSKKRDDDAKKRDDEPKKRDDEKPKKRANSDDEKPKKRAKHDDDDEKPKKRSKSSSESESEEERPKKSKKRNSKRSDDSDEESSKKSKIDFDELRAYGADIFVGETKPVTYKDDEVEPKEMKQILTALMNEHTRLNDDLMKTNFVKSVYLMSQVLLHGKTFSGEPTQTFEEYLNTLDIEHQGKWTWPVMTEELSEVHFNHACETIFLSLHHPRIPSPFQEFLSVQNRKMGFKNLLPYVDLSKKKGMVAPQSKGVHAGVGLQGHYCMLAKNIKHAKFESAYPYVDATLLSNQFKGNPPIKIHCGNNNEQVRLGKMEKFILIMGGFAEMQITAGPNNQKLLRQRILVAVKVGYDNNLSANFKKYLKKYEYQEACEVEVEEQN